jgi:integrase
MGSMREKKPGIWELRVHLGRDPLSGKIQQRSRSFTGGKRQARAALSEFEAETAGHRAPATDATFGFVLDEWFTSAAHGLAETTAHEYRRIIDKNLHPQLGAIPLRKLTVKHLDDLYRGMTSRGLAARTVRQTHAVARKALGQAQKWGWVQVNVAGLASPPAVRQEEIEPPTVAELHRILEQAPHPDLASMWRVKAELGARRGEMCGLQWRDLDWAEGQVTIRRSVAHVGTRLVVKDTKTHQQRRLKVDVGVMNLLAERLLEAEAVAAAEAPGGCLRPEAFVWSREPDGGRPWRPDQTTGSWTRARTAAGLPTVRQHDLRHLNATLQMAAGVPLKTIQKRLGHANSVMLHTVYGHAQPGDDGDAAELLGRLLGAGATQPGRGERGESADPSTDESPRDL